ncbi:MAG: hypothetical protein MUF21_02550 [Gemmatimonadaceae bacterium]|jgi:hypothetical protein|nr:hypothetical protein [Gemmatimonadaceae bacterium]
MNKFLRVPEKLFAIVMWVVSLVFASFLIGLGGTVVRELPGVDRVVEVEQFIDRRLDDSLAAAITTRDERIEALGRERELAVQAGDTAQATEASARRAFDTWLATRTATTDPGQDPEVIARTRRLDSLEAQVRESGRRVEAIDAQLIEQRQGRDGATEQRDALRRAAQPALEQAQFRTELRVFGIRLALTLPLLLVGWWAIMKRRKADSWPLWRGFVLFALVAFFVELVPYLPSYGGYVRYTVGILLSIVVGQYGIRWMRAYLARRAEAEQQSIVERKQSLGRDESIRKVAANICPGCERPIVGSAGVKEVNFCVHCGMQAYDECGTCRTRKNAFFAFCPTCGARAAGGLPTEPPPLPPSFTPPPPPPVPAGAA